MNPLRLATPFAFCRLPDDPLRRNVPVTQVPSVFKPSTPSLTSSAQTDLSIRLRRGTIEARRLENSSSYLLLVSSSREAISSIPLLRAARTANYRPASAYPSLTVASRERNGPKPPAEQHPNCCDYIRRLSRRRSLAARRSTPLAGPHQIEACFSNFFTNSSDQQHKKVRT